jgi:hypothetical protein
MQRVRHASAPPPAAEPEHKDDDLVDEREDHDDDDPVALEQTASKRRTARFEEGVNPEAPEHKGGPRYPRDSDANKMMEFGVMVCGVVAWSDPHTVVNYTHRNVNDLYEALGPGYIDRLGNLESREDGFIRVMSEVLAKPEIAMACVTVAASIRSLTLALPKVHPMVYIRPSSTAPHFAELVGCYLHDTNTMFKHAWPHKSTRVAIEEKRKVALRELRRAYTHLSLASSSFSSSSGSGSREPDL